MSKAVINNLAPAMKSRCREDLSYRWETTLFNVLHSDSKSEWLY